MEDRAPWLYRVVTARSGQSEVMGLMFIIGLTVIASALVVVIGGQALQATQSQSEVERAEHVMTLFDSRAAAIALSSSSSQRLAFPESGTHTVRPDTGWLRINHTNYNGSGNTEVLYNETLGSVTYESGDTTIAYQGGGVWLLGESGEARMVSPPEFHYRGATLTLPVIRVKGSGSIAGGGSATIRPVTRAQPVYPDGSKTYTGTSIHYRNPAEEGSVNVTVHSKYYEGWAEHFRSRTDGTVTLDHENETVTVHLLTLGDIGFFEMPHDSDSGSAHDDILVRGLEGSHSLENLNITLIDDTNDSANMNNLQWSMWAEEGQKELELHLRKDHTDSGDIVVKATVYYSNDGGTTYHGWMNRSAFRTEERDFDGDGENETVLEVDWTGDTKMNYTHLSSDDVTHFDNPGDDTLVSPVEWTQHDGEPVDRNGSVVTEGTDAIFAHDGHGGDPDTSKINNITNHYFGIMGTEWELKVDDKDSDTVNEDQSQGNIMYPGSDKFITYLHVTENEIEVTLN